MRDRYSKRLTASCSGPEANLRGANLDGADLDSATGVNLEGALGVG